MMSDQNWADHSGILKMVLFGSGSAMDRWVVEGVLHFRIEVGLLMSGMWVFLIRRQIVSVCSLTASISRRTAYTQSYPARRLYA